MTQEQYEQKVFDKHGNSVKVLSEYLGGTVKIKICYICEKHSETIKEINAKNVFTRSFNPCDECRQEKKSISGRTNKRSKSYFYDRLVDMCRENNGYLITKQWTKSKDSYEFKCENEDHPIFITTADSIISKKQWCPYCSGRKGDFKKEINDILESKNYKWIDGEYINAFSHITVKCLNDEYEWKITPLNIKKGRGCPLCSIPYSEKVVYKYLKDRGHDVRLQYRFDDLKGENNESYKFDFAIFKDGYLFYLLEIDDNEHRYNTKSEKRIGIKIRDNLKNEYCKNNNINILRLDYERYKPEFKNEEWYYDYISKNVSNFEEMICHSS